MRTIHKSTLEVVSKQSLELPIEARIIKLDIQHGIPTIWYICDTDDRMELRTFIVFGTGHNILDADVQDNKVLGKMPINRNHAGPFYVGSVQMGAYVWHYFEEV